MKLLFIAPYIPSPIRVRTYQLLRQLVRLGCKVTLVALEDTPLSESLRTELTELCDATYFVPLPRREANLRCLAALPTPKPLWVAYCDSPLLISTVQKLVQTEQFDAAHVEHLRAATVRKALGDLPCVLDAVDCITALQRQMFEQSAGIGQRLLAWEESVKLRHWEPRAYAAYREIAVTSQFDAEALSALGTRPQIHVIPNGVDSDYFHPDPKITPEPETLVFSGKMSYRANENAVLWFAARLWPRLKSECPNLHWIIVGSEPSKAIRALAVDRSITITGYVGDIRPYLSKSAIAICPLQIGVGIQNKALEAMAMGKPVVCSPIAGRALVEATHQGGITIAESDDAFIAACLSFLREPERRKAAGMAARQFVERHHRWDCTARAFTELYAQAGAAW